MAKIEVKRRRVILMEMKWNGCPSSPCPEGCVCKLFTACLKLQLSIESGKG